MATDSPGIANATARIEVRTADGYVCRGAYPLDTQVSNESPLTIEMLRAGVAAYRAWNPDEEEIEVLVAAVYLAMCDAKEGRSTSLQFYLDHALQLMD